MGSTAGGAEGEGKQPELPASLPAQAQANLLLSCDQLLGAQTQLANNRDQLDANQTGGSQLRDFNQFSAGCNPSGTWEKREKEEKNPFSEQYFSPVHHHPAGAQDQQDDISSLGITGKACQAYCSHTKKSHATVNIEQQQTSTLDGRGTCNWRRGLTVEKDQQDRQHHQRQRGDLSGSSSKLSNYIKHVAHKFRQNWFPSKDKGPENLDKMIKQRYLLFLILLSLLMIACLLTTLVISRSVGQTEQDVLLSKASSEQLKSDQERDELELRQLELVDLIECDKTFAYTRWRLQIRVPKSTPIYEQRNRFARSLAAPTQMPVLSLKSPSVSPSSTSATNGQSKINRKDSQGIAVSGSTSSESRADEEAQRSTGGIDHDDGRFFLTSTSDFVDEADHRQSAGRVGQLESVPVQGESSQRGALPKESRSVDGLAKRDMDQEESSESGLASSPREDQAFDPQDPMQLASSELKFSLTDAQSSNSTLVDCFMVDIEKRLDQKIAIERENRKLASTRQVSLSKMLSAIQSCRQLTWKALGPEPADIQAAQSRPQSSLSTPLDVKPDRLATPLKQTGDSSTSGQELSRSVQRGLAKSESQPAPVSSSGAGQPAEDPLREKIRPVEPRGSKSVAASRPSVAESEEDPIARFLSAFASASMPSVESTTSQTSKGNSDGLTPSEARQTPPVIARIVDTGRVIGSPASQPAPEEEDEETRRGSYLTMGMSMISGIVPNTLWCGLGDRASNYSQLGSEYMVDSCCRAHDHCPIRLKPFAADYGLINWSMSTRSHCDCDLDFNDCLKQVNSKLSNVIKALYFRLVGSQCIYTLEAGTQRPETSSTEPSSGR